MNTLQQSSIDEIAAFAKAGESVRRIARVTGHSKITVAKYRDLALGKTRPLCKCGLDARHQGWCANRLTRSAARQEFLRTWNRPPGTCRQCRGICFSYGERSLCEMCYRGQCLLKRAQQLLVERNCKICGAAITASTNAKTCLNPWCKRIFAFYYTGGRNRPPTVRGGKNNGLRFCFFLSDYIRRFANG